MSRRRFGYTLVELLVAMVVSGVFLAGLASLLQNFAERTREAIARVDRAQAVRTVWVVLGEELEAGLSGVDWELEDQRALTLRAWRGLGRVEGPAEEPGRWVIDWRGHRAPRAGVDSLLVLSDEGRWDAVALDWVGGTGDRLWEWAGVGTGEPVLVRYFESGRYSIEDRAFRYRRGSGGRQPLTPELFGTGSGFERVDAGLRVRLEFRDSGAGAVEWEIPVS